MSQAPVGTSGLVRVTVTSGTRRVDLVLPGAVPVAELVPELARSVGLLDAATVYGGYRVVTAEGRPLANDSGLTLQGVEDGGVITVTAGIDEESPRVYDDVVEAMTDVVEHDLKPWEPASSRRTALGRRGPADGARRRRALHPGRLDAGRHRRGHHRRRAGGRRDRALARAARGRGGGGRRLDRGGVRRGRRADVRPRRGRVLRLPGGRRRRRRDGGRADLPDRPRRGPHAGAAADRGRRRLPHHRAAAHRCRLRRGRRAHRRAVAGRDGRQRVPVAGPGRHRHVGRPALLTGRHHRRPRRDRPAPGRHRRPGRPRDPGRDLGDRRADAGADRAAGRAPRHLRHPARGGLLR